MSHLDKAVFFKSGQTKRLESIVTTTHKSHSTQVKQYPVQAPNNTPLWQFYVLLKIILGDRGSIFIVEQE